MDSISKAELKALQSLRRTWGTIDFVYPAEIGMAVTGGMKKDGSRHLKAQGLGRVGGSMGARLVRLGLAASRGRGYAITSAGWCVIETKKE